MQNSPSIAWPSWLSSFGSTSSIESSTIILVANCMDWARLVMDEFALHKGPNIEE